MALVTTNYIELAHAGAHRLADFGGPDRFHKTERYRYPLP